MAGQADAEGRGGLVVSIDLGELWTDGNVEERILGVVAAKLLERVEEDVRSGVTDEVRRIREAIIREQIEPIIREALEKPMMPTNQYGEARPGAEPVTLVEMIEAQVKKFTTVKASIHNSREGTELEQMIEQIVDRQFKSELKKAVDDAKTKALEKVREAAGEVIADAVKRAGGML